MRLSGWFCVLCGFATANVVAAVTDVTGGHWGWLGIDAGFTVWTALLAVREWRENNP